MRVYFVSLTNAFCALARSFFPHILLLLHSNFSIVETSSLERQRHVFAFLSSVFFLLGLLFVRTMNGYTAFSPRRESERAHTRRHGYASHRVASRCVAPRRSRNAARPAKKNRSAAAKTSGCLPSVHPSFCFRPHLTPVAPAVALTDAILPPSHRDTCKPHKLFLLQFFWRNCETVPRSKRANAEVKFCLCRLESKITRW